MDFVSANTRLRGRKMSSWQSRNRKKISSFWAQQTQCQWEKHLLINGYEGKVPNFLAVFQTTSPHCFFLSSSISLHVFLKNSMLLCFFKILALIFSLLICKSFQVFRDSFNTILVLENIRTDNNKQSYRKILLQLTFYALKNKGTFHLTFKGGICFLHI